MDQTTVTAAQKAATKYAVPLATVLAVTEQESAGHVYGAGKLPVVRHEGHYLYARLKGTQRDRAVKAGLAAPRAGQIKNPASQEDRWSKLINPAMQINESAEIESVSWGVGQVMGANWKSLGFMSAAQFRDYVCQGIEQQIDVMMRFCKANSLLDELQRGDFTGFARGYNGPANVSAYAAALKTKASHYHGLYPDAVVKGTVKGAPVADPVKADNAASMVRMGVTGAKVREVQELLHRAGYAVEVDGDFGPATKQAVTDFQRAKGLEADGLVGPATWTALEPYRAAPDEKPGVPSPAEAIVATPQGRQGTAAVGAGTTIAVLNGGIQKAADTLSPVAGASGYLHGLYTALTVAAVVLTVAGVVWVGYGWLRANRTHGLKR